jgi:hypothetical protein
LSTTITHEILATAGDRGGGVMGEIIRTYMDQSLIVYDTFLETDEKGDTYRHQLVGTHTEFVFVCDNDLGIMLNDNISVNTANTNDKFPDFFATFFVTKIAGKGNITEYY